VTEGDLHTEVIHFMCVCVFSVCLLSFCILARRECWAVEMNLLSVLVP
jgi:hypothetical protein